MSTAFSAPLGPPMFAASPDALVELAAGLELDSCGSAFAAASRNAQVKKRRRSLFLDFRAFTSILCRAQNGRQILREAGARQNFIASRGLRLSGKLCLHVREEADHANVLAHLA